MRKNLLFFLLAFFAFFSAKADLLTVADGTDTSDRIPIYGYYWDTAFKNTMIYSADELADMEGGTINAITFYANSDYTALRGGTLTVSLGVVESTTATSHFTSGMTQVFSGVPTKDGNNCVITFATPFEYEGGNLAIELNLPSTAKGSNSPYIYFYGVTRTSATYHSYGAYNNSSTRNFLAKASFDYDPTESVPYAAKVSPETCDFGAVATGSSNEMNVTVRNSGENAFTPQVTITGDGFSTTYTPAELATKQSATIPVAFNPTDEGNYTGTLTINCGEAGTFTVDLSGSAANEITVAAGNATNSYLPVYGLFYDESSQANQMIYPASMLTAINGKRIKSMTFYNSSATAYFSDGNVTFSLANTTETTFASATRLTPEDLTQVYSAAAPGGTLSEWTITFPDDANFVYNGGSLLIDVATTKGTYKSVSFVGEDGHANASWNSYGGGSGTLRNFLPKVKFTYEDASAPIGSVSVDPTSWDFDQLFVDDNAATKEFTVTNTTEADVTLALTGLTGTQFSATSDVATVAANGGTATVTVTYTPSATAGEHSATLTIVDELTVALTGSTIEHVISGTVTPATLTFETFVDTPETKTITVENTGNTAFTPIFSALEAPFSIADATEIAAGETATFEVTYSPTAVGENEATLTVTINGQTTNVALNGACYETPQEIIVADGTDENKIVPFYGFYTDQASVYGQMIYPASMLQSLVGKKILGFKFYSSTGIQFSGCTFDVTMGVTEQSTFTGTSRVAISGGVTASVTPEKNATEIEITFSEPFQYDGGNLIIDTYITHNTNLSGADATDGATKYYGMNQSGNTAINSKGGEYGLAGSAQFLPKISFSFMGTPVAESVTLAELLSGGVNDKEYVISNDLAMANKAVAQPYAFLTDGNNNWIKVEYTSDLESAFNTRYIKGGTLKGTLSNIELNPVLTTTEAPESTSTAVEYTIAENYLNGEVNFKPNQVVALYGYWKDGKVYGTKNFTTGELSGKYVTLNTAWAGSVTLEEGARYILACAMTRNSVAAPSDAMHRAQTTDTGYTANVLNQPVVTGINAINAIDGNTIDGKVNVYNMQGQLIKRGVEAGVAAQGLPAGIYLIGNKKVVVK